MINTYENIKANEDSNLSLNLQSPENILPSFQFLLRRDVTCESLEIHRIRS